jgi:ribose transport system permease protein
MNLRSLLPLTLPLVFALIVVIFALAAPGFLSGGNLKSLVLNNFALLAIVAIGMTYAVGGRRHRLVGGHGAGFRQFQLCGAAQRRTQLGRRHNGRAGGRADGGGVNAGLIAGLRISPFLATLGTLFIGTSAQQLLGWRPADLSGPGFEA